jgi:hypothetical protein
VQARVKSSNAKGSVLQLIHEVTVVKADGYDGPWVTEIIRRLQGHHEPQEELLFHHLLADCRPCRGREQGQEKTRLGAKGEI